MFKRTRAALLLAPLALSAGAQTAAPAATPTTVEAHTQAVLAFGPRVAGSPANEQARAYFEAQFRALGYETRRERFTYPRFDDLGSDVRVGERTLTGAALQNSAGGTVTAAVARVPGVGTPEEFARADVRGKVAVVARGQIPFAQKAQNALAAGAAGLVIVNQGGELRGTLGTRIALPVLGVSAATGEALVAGQTVTLAVRVREGEVQAFNVIAHKSGVTKPEILFGGHMDSVQGAPGANDNLSGSLAVLELAQRTANTPLSARAYFMLFDGEEDGLIGSRDFVAKNPELVRGLKAMFNFDMVGVAAEPLSISGEAKLVEAARRLPGVTARESASGGSDHAPFAGAGVPTLFFHRGIDANYHQPGDRVLDPALVRATVDAAQTLAGGVLGTAARR